MVTRRKLFADCSAGETLQPLPQTRRGRSAHIICLGRVHLLDVRTCRQCVCMCRQALTSSGAFWKCCSFATKQRKPGQCSLGHTSSSRSGRSGERTVCRRCRALVDSVLSIVSLKRRSMGPKKVRHSYKKATTGGRSTSKPSGYAQVAWRLSLLPAVFFRRCSCSLLDSGLWGRAKDRGQISRRDLEIVRSTHTWDHNL